jgi:hypothetical protein
MGNRPHALVDALTPPPSIVPPLPMAPLPMVVLLPLLPLAKLMLKIVDESLRTIIIVVIET